MIRTIILISTVLVILLATGPAGGKPAYPELVEGHNWLETSHGTVVITVTVNVPGTAIEIRNQLNGDALTLTGGCMKIWYAEGSVLCDTPVHQFSLKI